MPNLSLSAPVSGETIPSCDSALLPILPSTTTSDLAGTEILSSKVTGTAPLAFDSTKTGEVLPVCRELSSAAPDKCVPVEVDWGRMGEVLWGP